MVRRPESHTLQTVLLVLLVQAGLFTGTWLVVWTMIHQPTGHWSRIPLLVGTGIVALLTLGVSIQIAVRWRQEAQQGLAEVQGRFRHLVDSIEGIVWESDAVSLEFHFVS